MRARVEMAQGISDELMHLYATEPGSLRFKRAFLRAAVFWFLVFEGVWFWMGLLGPVQQLARIGIFRNTAEQFAYIARDETQHIRFGVELIREFMVQYPEAMNEETLTMIRVDTIRAIVLEGQFISYCLKDGPIVGYSATAHVETAKFFANLRMRSIGLPEIYPGAQHQFPWMAEQMEIRKEKNFFETRVTEYQAGGALNWDDDDPGEEDCPYSSCA
jgi:ribonucleoside-diphosphate reductase beta chain